MVADSHPFDEEQIQDQDQEHTVRKTGNRPGGKIKVFLVPKYKFFILKFIELLNKMLNSAEFIAFKVYTLIECRICNIF